MKLKEIFSYDANASSYISGGAADVFQPTKQDDEAELNQKEESKEKRRMDIKKRIAMIKARNKTPTAAQRMDMSPKVSEHDLTTPDAALAGVLRGSHTADPTLMK